MEEAEARYPIQQLERVVAKQEQAKNKPVMIAGPQLPEKKMTNEGDEDAKGDPVKKIKTEESSLLPENMWLMMNPGQLTLNIKIPILESESKNLRGQLLQLKLDPNITVQAMKETLSNMLDGFGVNKMRLKTVTHTNLKDEKTVAFYNLVNGTVVELALKEKTR